MSGGTLAKGNPPAHRTQYIDFGPEYLTKGIIAHQPPKPGADYATLVPKSDPDGNDIAGLKMPWVSVPLGALTGWNLRAASIGAEGSLLANTGSYLPFSAERIGKQFRGRPEYLRQIEAAARQMVTRRFLLEGDVPRIVRMGERIWDWTAKDIPQVERGNRN